MAYPLFYRKYMSTKIYNGITIKGISTLDGALAFCNKIRDSLRNEANEYAANCIKNIACLYYDYYHAAGKSLIDDKDSFSPLFESVHQYNEMMDKSSPDDYKYELCLTSIDGVVMGIPFFPEYSKLSETIMTHPSVHPFPYWDNTDPPEYVTEEEWNTRGKLWKKAIGDSGIPAESMFTITLFNAYALIPDDAFMDTLPSPEMRTSTLAGDMAFTEFAEINKSVDDSEKHNVTKMIKHVQEIKKEKVLEIQDKINPNLTFADLEKEIKIC